MSSLPTAIQRVQRGLSTVELVYMSQSSWPLPTHRGPIVPDPLKVSILDSSYNPPTLAHLALAHSPFPDGAPGSDPAEDGDYDAKLLLLSVRNADKVLKAGDATYVQRLEMMILLAKELERSPDANVAVAIIDEPTFVGKARLLRGFMRERLMSFNARSSDFEEITAPPRVQPVFMMGTDTLERLFSPRYYASEEAMVKSLQSLLSPSGDDARVVCAWRVMPGAASKEQEEKPVAAVEGYVNSGRIILIDVGEETSPLSSSEVRELRTRDNPAWSTKVIPSVAKYIEEHGLYKRS